jgi:peptide/nickel transport system substrate-binding protein
VQLRKSAALLAVAAVTAATLAGCNAPAVDDEPSTLRIGVASGLLAGQYDPYNVAMYQTDIMAVYETLTVGQFEPDLTKDMGLEMRLAKSFSLSDDRRKLSIELRDDVNYSDGSPMTAETVVALFNILGSDEASPYFSNFELYGAEFEVVDDFAFEVTSTTPMDAPGGLLGVVLGEALMMNPEAAKDRETLARVPAGTGPYTVAEVIPQVSATLERNPDYWGGDDVFPFDEIIIKNFDDQVALLNALKSGQIDVGPVDITTAEEATASGLQIFETPGRFTALWFGDRAGTIIPALGDVRVRQAIAYAFDREAINESINRGHGTVTSQGGTPGIPYYVEGGDTRYDYDPDKARELMAEAGYADGFDVTIPSTTFLGINKWEPIVQQTLASLNIRVTWEATADANAFFTAALSGDYPILLYSEQPGGLDVVFIKPGAIFDHPAYTAPEAAPYWDAISNGKADEVLDAQRAVGEFTLEEAWLAVFANTNNAWAARPGFTLRLNGDGYAISLWEIKPAE